MQSRGGNVKILQPSTSIKQTEPQRCTITPAQWYFHLAPYKVGGVRGWVSFKTQHDMVETLNSSIKAVSVVRPSLATAQGWSALSSRWRESMLPLQPFIQPLTAPFLLRCLRNGSRPCLHICGVFLTTKHFLCGLVCFEKQKTLLYCARVYRKLRPFSFSLFYLTSTFLHSLCLCDLIS